MAGRFRRSQTLKQYPPRHGETQATPDFAMSIDFPKEEERILARWKEIGAFLRQVELVRTFC
jgi:hypothetical protein